MLPLSFLTLSCILLVAAETLLSPCTAHEKRTHVPAGWSQIRKHDPTSVLPLRFGLTQSNIHNIDDFITDVSNPESPNYANHWSAERIAETFAPNTETVDAVRSWLLGSGFDSERIRLTHTKAWIEVNATVEEAERLLHTEYYVYQHRGGKEHVACDQYHLPAHITQHVDLITPTVHFNVILTERDAGQPARKIGEPGFGQGPKTDGVFEIKNLFTDLKDCDKQTTPNCLRALYRFVYEPLSAKNNSFGIVEYTPQAYLQSDLDIFHQNFSKNLVGKSPTLVSIDGGYIQTEQQNFNSNGESNLDLQYGMNLVTAKQNVTLYQVGDMEEGASFNNFLDALDASYCTFNGGDDPSQDGKYPDDLPGGYKGKASCGTTKPANVISTSYGYNEADLSPAYTARQCAEYAKLGMMGVTVLYSSGDNGVAGNNGACLDPDGSQSSHGKRFNPSFPSTCPYVTSVGATQVNPGKTVFDPDPESACETVIYSGGGFSNYFAMPNYQKRAVHEYLNHDRPTYPANKWNSTGISRAYPDISVNGANYVVAVDGIFGLVYGTSASSPVLGAILTMINDARITFGKKPIGFINPTIYSHKFNGAFKDITSGGNQGCGTSGYTAVEGWDPVTGLGTPIFPEMLARWLLLP